MRILHVVPAFVPAWTYGGPVAVASELSKALADRGHQVTVWTTDVAAKGLPSRDEIDGVNVLRFTNQLDIDRPLTLRLPLGVLRARRLVEGFDLIHLHEYRTPLNVFVGRAALRANIPYAITGHGTMGRVPGRFVKHAFDAVWGSPLLRGAKRVFVLSERERREALALGAAADAVTPLPNGIRLADYQAEVDTEALRRAHGIPNAPIVLFLGRLHRLKAPRLLLKAFLDTADRHDAHLLFVGPDEGEGPALERRVVAAAARDRVSFAGFLRGSQKLAALRAASVFAIPRFRGFPVAFLEAAAFGLPVVTTTLGDHLDILDEIGIVTQPTARALGDGLVRALSDRDVRAFVEARAKQTVESEYTWDAVTDGLLSHYHNMIA